MTAASPRHGAPDTGSAQTTLLLVVAALLGLPVLLGAPLLGHHAGTLTACDQQTIPQPGIAPAAQADIPAAYLALYQVAGQRYGIPWSLLAAIGKTESDHGRDHSRGIHSGANSAGAAGPMQIGIGGRAGNNWGGTLRHPASEHTGGVAVDGNGDGWADVHDPADAIPGAARFLLAHGAPANLARAVFAYNPDRAYVRHVMAQAARYAITNSPATTDPGTDPQACPGNVDAFTGAPGGVAGTVLAYARAQIGKPYVFGGTGPDGFDCSGLTMMAYRAAHITIPRLSDAQYWFGKRVPAGTEQPGDLVFFDYKPGHTGPGHVGIVDDPATGMMVVAPHTGARVRLQSYKTYPGGAAGFTRPAARAVR
ncbi:C40 family peptidase [Actinoallomurus rhizosphaericola]|uniref:C40 family peptidase n=1 Tax=Actinoallomurus rhizosphaericola TaxID=2952536 RepID=UPI0020924B91|nr:bifunctional lytic transglycosylase/C40 family peptidase [Actinoallomurus rhizosphaericola]MCO5998465.1 bifunctional lytic transglycosylase/C40 family peptidase [Actinoallomurus rhizosphaericola]